MVWSHLTDAAIEPRITENSDDLELRLSQIGRIFDIPRLINETKAAPRIIKFYDDAAGVYLLPVILVTFGGFFHYGISYGGKFKKQDVTEQAKLVERYIRNSEAKNVLELAHGFGGNIAFLAKRNPAVNFDGVDLSLNPLKRYTKIPNAHFQIGDFHDLSAFGNNAYDIVFVIEALCYSTEKLHVLREVKKKLKRGGFFIIIDAYRADRATPLSSSEEIMRKLIEASWVLNKFECIQEVEGYMLGEYSIAEASDLTQCIFPSVMRMARVLRLYFAHPMFARVVDRLLPSDVPQGWIAPYLTPTSLKGQIFCYYVHVLRNDK
jgi:ubiquinone/menaquinone biosynthesis C-methylase UbiE